MHPDTRTERQRPAAAPTRHRRTTAGGVDLPLLSAGTPASPRRRAVDPAAADAAGRTPFARVRLRGRGRTAGGTPSSRPKSKETRA